MAPIFLALASTAGSATAYIIQTGFPGTGVPKSGLKKPDYCTKYRLTKMNTPDFLDIFKIKDAFPSPNGMKVSVFLNEGEIKRRDGEGMVQKESMG